jgi:parvulin-like peptidyl-prolyl isomerase
LARVNGEPVYSDEVQRKLDESLRGREIAPEARAVLQAEALEQLINQRLVAAWLARENQGVTAAEVDAAMKVFRSRAEEAKLSFDEWLKQLGMSEEALRRQTAWRMGWQAYLRRNLTDETLQRHFEEHLAEFDGTEVRVAHILWKVEPSAGPEALTARIDEARRVRQQIVDGQLSFAAAAEKFSAAPTGKQGGDLGFVPRHGRMHEAFSRAAFSLKQGDISQPVTSPFGVHLIQCLEIRPGAKAWTDVRGPLHRAVAQQLFEQIAAKERPRAKIEKE